MVDSPHNRSRPASPHILISRPDHLGDLLLTLPGAALLRRAFPGAQITFLTSPRGAEVPGHCPDVDQTLTAPFPPVTAGDDPPGWSEIVGREAARLRGRFELALIPRIDDPWSGALLAAAGIPLRLGFDHPRTKPFLTHALPVRRGHVSELARRLALAAARTLGQDGRDDWERECPRFVPTVSEERQAAALLARLAPLAGERPVVLQPGSGWPLKNWPPERWGELAARIAARHGLYPLVAGGPAERALAAAVVAAADGQAQSVAGALSLGGLAALYRRVRLVVGTDSGALHLAAAMGTPVVALFGPADPREFGPLAPRERGRVVRVDLPCSPCGTLLDPPCGARREPACVTGITIDAVLAAVDDLSPPAPPPRLRPGAARPPR